MIAAMARELLAGGPWLLLFGAALGLLVSAFALVLWRAFREDPEELERAAWLPLDDGGPRR